MQEVSAMVGPLTTADAGIADNMSPAAVAAKIASIRPVVGLHSFMKILRWTCVVHSGLIYRSRSRDIDNSLLPGMDALPTCAR